MLVRLRHALRRVSRPLDGGHAAPSVTAQARRRLVTTKKGAKAAGLLQTHTPTAKKLHDGDYWQPRLSKKKGHPLAMQPTDSRRVNVVSDKLCDDIIKTLGPSLERHNGCDLIDINPGAGRWSRALHDAIQPRRHIMLDSSAEAYKPLLQDAMGDRPNVEIIPRDGLVWSQLKEVFTSHIDPYHPQVARSQAGTINQPERNDMLLVTANLTTFPKRSIFSFDSLATMVLYQLLSSIRTSTLFQRYGCVRMLLWANDENKRPLLPRSVLQRKRVGFEAEISCDWIHEVAGYDFVDPATARLYLRDEWLNLESTAATLRRMEQAGIPIIPGRETELLSTVLADPDLRNGIGNLAGHRPPDIRRPFKAELEELQARGPESHDEQDIKRLSALKFRETYDTGDSQFYLQLLQLKESAMAMDPASPEFRQFDEAFDNHMENLKKNRRQDFGVIRDNYHHFRHNHPFPTLLWDRRATEPLTVDPATELYPNTPACLLDIQPKPMNPLFRQYGPGTSRTGDISDVLLRLAFSNLNWPVEERAMDTFWPGFKDMAGNCPSLRDAARGGSPLTGRGALTLRAMNETHWAELMQAWLDWPFRPSYEAMLGRLTEDVSYGDGEDSVAGGGGVGVMP